MLANVNRDNKERPSPYKAEDFIYWRKRGDETDEPVLLDDPVAQSNLIRAVMFGKSPG